MDRRGRLLESVKVEPVFSGANLPMLPAYANAGGADSKPGELSSGQLLKAILKDANEQYDELEAKVTEIGGEKQMRGMERAAATSQVSIWRNTWPTGSRVNSALPKRRRPPLPSGTSTPMPSIAVKPGSSSANSRQVAS